MSGFTKEWYEAHQAKNKARTEANRAALRQGPPKARKGAAKDVGTVKKANVVIGIDPGVKTGMGIYRNGKLADVVTTTIIQAIDRVKKCHEASNVMVYVEDARMATYWRKGPKSAAMAQGAGSIKRDCKIWADELTRLEIPHKMVRPNKLSNQLAEDKPRWQKLTGWTKRSSEHARDAVMIAMKYA